MSKHNPGPWRVDGQAHDMAGSAIIRDAGGFPVASTRSWIKEQHDANARLVAAAPDLLKELKVFVDIIALYYPAIFESEIRSAKEAIAKAEGL